MAQYNFPLLKVEDVVLFFRDVLPELKLSEVDFKTPNTERVQRFYASVMEVIGEINMDSLNQQHLEASKHFERPDLHEASFSIVTFTLVLECFMKACGVQDFNMIDVTDPKPKRFLRMASAIINFYHFKQERMDVIERLNAESAALKDQYSQLSRLNDDIKSKINMIKASKAEQEPTIKELEQQIIDYNNRISELREGQNTEQKTISEIKTSIAEKKSNLAHVQSKIKTEKEKGERLARQIVQSPERLKGEMERMRNQLAQLNTARETKMSRLLELKEQKENMNELENNCEQGLKLAMAIHTEMEKERKVNVEVADLDDQIVATKDELRDLSAQDQQTKRVLVTRKDKLSKLGLVHQHKMTGMKERLTELKHDYEKLQQIQSSDMVQKQALDLEKRELQQMIEKNRNDHQMVMSAMSQKYAQLLEALDAYHRRLGDAWEKVKNTMQTCDLRQNMMMDTESD